jgi:hypothetical protein
VGSHVSGEVITSSERSTAAVMRTQEFSIFCVHDRKKY